MKKRNILLLIALLSLNIPSSKVQAEELEKYDVSDTFEVGTFTSQGPIWHYMYGATYGGKAHFRDMYPYNDGQAQPTTMEDGSTAQMLTHFVPYPAPAGLSESAVQYCTIAGGQWVHPGNNADAVYAFKVPKSGTLYATDLVSTSGSDGVRIKVLHKTAAQVAESITTETVIAFNLTTIDYDDNTQIFPTDSEWLNISAGSFNTTRFTTDNIAVQQNDWLFFILNKNGDINNDMTFFSPSVIYGESIPSNDRLVLNKDTLTLQKGSIASLIASIEPEGEIKSIIYWSTLDSSIVSVNPFGVLTANKVGETIIKAETEDGKLFAECQVIVIEKAVNSPPTDKGLNSLEITLIVVGSVVVIGGGAFFLIRYLKKKKERV
ncbi:MAG: hypothetical protein LBM99_01990 [Bacillales bacterium]|jgi:hypothetical protein|nr:hypothetical protein [Bacillales bacterium]